MEGASGDPVTEFSVALWLPPGVTPPPRLVQALTGKKVNVERILSPFAALSAMCRASRVARAARSGSVLALVVVYPEQQPDTVGVLEAAAKFAPGVRCWMFGPASNPRLRAIVETDIAGWGGAKSEPEIVVRPRPAETKPPALKTEAAPARVDYRTQAVGKPPLRLAGQGTFDLPVEAVDVDKKGSDEAGTGPARSQVLTAEELRMLLGEDGPDVAGQR